LHRGQTTTKKGKTGEAGVLMQYLGGRPVVKRVDERGGTGVRGEGVLAQFREIGKMELHKGKK